MVQKLKLLSMAFKITVTELLKALTEKVENYLNR